MEDQATVGGRRGFWFPLVLLGFGLLGLLGWDSVGESRYFGWFAYAPMSSQTGYQIEHGLGVAVYSDVYLPAGFRQPPLRDSSWTVLLTVTLVATVAWYGWRARRAGGSVRPYVAAAVAGAIVVPVASFVVGMAGTAVDPAGVVTSVGLPLLGLGALVGGWAYLRRGWRWRAAVLAVGGGCLVVGAATVLGAWAPGLLEPVLIAGGLLVLARFERSRLLVVVAGAVLVAMVVFPTGTLSMLLPAAIMLFAAIVALVRQSAPA